MKVSLWGITILSKCFSKFFDTVPKAPVITGINFALTFHSSCTSTLMSCYLSIISCSLRIMFWSPGIGTSIIKQLFSLCLAILFQSLYVYWYWSLIEVYIYHFPVQFLVYKHILETILENDKCKRIRDFNISTRKVHKTLHWLPRERYNFQCNAYQLILQWKLYLLHGNQ